MSEQSVRITLVRHGESVANRALRWQGQGDSPLSELGRAQAHALAARLAARRFDRVVASDLERASATAQALGRPFERDAGFREVALGAWEGMTRDEVAARFPRELERLAAGEDLAIGGGESYHSFCARVDHALERLRAALAPGQHALVVCHGGVIGAAVAGALGLRGIRELPIARIMNTALSELSYRAAGEEPPVLYVFNDALHLAALGSLRAPSPLMSALALVCERAPDPAYGEFAARYDAERHRALCGAPASGAWSVDALVRAIRARHPACRVALSATAERVRTWASETLWPEQASAERLSLPAAGSICHLIAVEGRTALLDYGVSVSGEASANST